MKYLAVDIGNVIYHTDMNGFIGTLSRTFNTNSTDVFRFLKSFQQFHDLGQTTMEYQISNYFNCKSDLILQDINKKWLEVLKPEPQMINLLRDLIADGHQIAILSNMGTEHVQLIEKTMGPVYKNLVKHFSCNVGARKPTMLYYQSFLWQYPEFKGCTYIDDLEENLESSKQFGFDPFHLDLSEMFPGYDDFDKMLKTASPLPTHNYHALRAKLLGS